MCTIGGDIFVFVGAPPSGRFFVCGSPALGAMGGGLRGLIAILWEPRPRGDCLWSAGLIATRASLLQGHGPAFCGSPALGAMGGGLRGLIAILWEPRPRGDCLWSAGLDRDEGVAPTGSWPCILWEHCPWGDGWWSAGLIATGASLLQKISAGVPVVEVKGPANFAGPIQPSGHGHKLVAVARGRDGAKGREREVETAGHHFFLDQHVKYTATGLTRHFRVHVKQHGPVGVAGKQ